MMVRSKVIRPKCVNVLYYDIRVKCYINKNNVEKIYRKKQLKRMLSCAFLYIL